MNFGTYKNILNFNQQFLPLTEKPLGELVTIGFLMNKTQKRNPFINYLSTAHRLIGQPVNASTQDKEAIAALPMDKKVFLVAKYLFNVYIHICKNDLEIPQELGFGIVSKLLAYKTQRIIPEHELAIIIAEAKESIISDALKRKLSLMSSQLFDISQRIN